METLLTGELLGVILGFFLGSFGTIVRDLWLERRQTRRVRLLIQLEIAGNFEDLEPYWDAISRNDERPADATADQIAAQISRKVVSVPMPSWNQAAWSAQIALVPAALTEAEIQATQRFYGGLSKLVGLHSQLLSLIEHDAANQRAAEQAEGAASVDRFSRIAPFVSTLTMFRQFDAAAPRLGQDFSEIVTSMLDVGNPLMQFRKATKTSGTHSGKKLRDAAQTQRN